MVLGEDGIIAQAKLAAEKTKEAEEQAKEDLANLTEEISNILTSDPPAPTKPTPTPKPTPPTLAEAKQKATPFETTTEVTVGNDTMTVPGGFRIKEGESIKEGIVITDAKTINEAGNEFVWVPVAINDMVWCKDHAGSIITFDKTTNTFTCTHDEGETHTPINQELVGKLYATTTGEKFTAGNPNTTYNANSGLREPAIVTGNFSGNGTDYDGSSSNLSTVVEGETKTKEKFLKQLQEEFYNMAKSVAKYGGFYIGRYETSLSASNKSESKAGAKSLYNDNSNHDWYGQYKYNKAYAEENENLAVVSSTIWGCQYDAMMKWMKGNGIDVTNATPTAGVEKNEDSTGRITGAPDSKDKLCNIYDLLGNSYEWTMEAYDAYDRVDRGGFYGAISSPSNRNFFNPTSTNGSSSARLSLYVNL